MAAATALTVAGWTVPTRADAAGPHNSVKVTTSGAPFELAVRGTYRTGIYDAGATRGLAYHAGTRRLFVVGQDGVAAIDAGNVDAPVHLFDLTIDGVGSGSGGTTAPGGRAEAVAVRPDGLGVAGVTGPAGDNRLVFFDAWSGLSLGAVSVAGEPTAIDIDGSGLRAVVACSHGPGGGSLVVVGLPRGIAAPGQAAVRELPGDSPSAVTATSHTAWVTSRAGLQALDLGDERVSTLAAGTGSTAGTQSVDHYTVRAGQYVVTSRVAGGTAAAQSEGSFSVWTPQGELVYDSGAELDQLAAIARQSYAGSAPAARRVADGPGPVVVGQVGTEEYLFVGLPGIGGVGVFDVSEPSHPDFVSYLNNRDFAVDPTVDLAAAGDLGPTSLVFIRAGSSPTGNPLVAVGNEVSGTTTLIELVPRPPASQAHVA